MESLAKKYADSVGLDTELAIIEIESGGNPNDNTPNSVGGAFGLMQLTSEDCEYYGCKNPFDPEDNIRAGVKQLMTHLKTFKGDMVKALIAYNAGPGNVINGKWRTMGEAVAYVPKISRYYRFPNEARLVADTTEPSESLVGPNGERIDSPIQLPPPVTEPVPTEIRDQMLEMVDYLKTLDSNVFMDARLNVIAAAAVEQMKNHSYAKENIENLAKLKASGLRLGQVKVDQVRAKVDASFAECYAKLKLKPGVRVGVALDWDGVKPIWCVVSCSR